MKKRKYILLQDVTIKYLQTTHLYILSHKECRPRNGITMSRVCKIQKMFNYK